MPDLIDSITDYIDVNNDNSKTHLWTATAESILAKVARARTTLTEGGS